MLLSDAYRLECLQDVFWMKIKINKSYKHLSDFVRSIPAGLFENSGQILHDGRNMVKLFEYEGKKYVVKRFKRPHLINRIAYTFFRPSKASRGYRNATHLIERGINTPEPIAYIEAKDNLLLDYSYLITEYTDWQPIAKVINEGGPLFEILNDALVDYTVRLHELGINHCDYNKTNILYREVRKDKIIFMLIDVNRMSFGRMSKTECLSSIKRMFVEYEPARSFVEKYAAKRGWDKQKAIKGIDRLMAEFLAKRQAKKRIKSFWQREHSGRPV